MRTIAAAIGLEGAFLIFGTLAVAVGSSYISPVAPWIVLGVALLLGVVSSLTRASAETGRRPVLTIWRGRR